MTIQQAGGPPIFVSSRRFGGPIRLVLARLANFFRGGNMRILKRVGGIAIFFVLLSQALPAQEITGTISGTVYDSSGGAVPDASVTVTSLRTGATRVTITTQAGVFFFTSLPVGEYKLLVDKLAFEKYELTSIQLHVDDKLNFTIKLQVGAVAERVVVSAQVSPLQTENAEVSNLVGTQQMLALPLSGRNFNQLVDLVPGVAPDNNTVNAGTGIFSDTSVSIDGNLSNSNLYLVDGEYNLDSGGNGNLLVTPSVDAIEEFKVLRNNYSAEFGGATGGVVNVITKSGTQAFHGSVFEFLRNDILDANNFFLNSSEQPKSPLRYNDFGFAVGGPVWIPGHYNKERKSDFFFFSMEWHRTINGQILTGIVPSQRQRNGVLNPPCSEVIQPPPPQPPIPCDMNPGLSFDPNESPLLDGETNLPGATPNTPSPSIDPNSLAFMMRMLPPNTAISNGFNFIASAPTGTFDLQPLVRWDHYFGSKHVLTMRYAGLHDRLTNINDQLFGLGDPFPNVSQDWHWYGVNAIVKLTSTISPRLVNDFQFGYSNNNLAYRTSASSDPTISGRQKFFYTELFPETSGSFPSLNPVGPFSDNGSNSSSSSLVQNTAPFSNRTDNFQYKDDLSYTFGKHNLKFGAFFRFNRKHEPANGGGNFTAGTFTFGSMSDFLLGNIQTYSEEQTQNYVPDRSHDYAVYAQDTWKLFPKLTLSLGLRYQILWQVYSADKNVANFRPNAFVAQPQSCIDTLVATNMIDPTPPSNCILNDGLVDPTMPGISRSTLKEYYNDWEPRVGIAYQARNWMVVRAGFGIFGGRDAVSQTSSLGQQGRFDTIATLNGVTYGDLAPFNPAEPQPTVNVRAQAQDYKTPTSYQYNLTTQYLITRNTSLEVGYVGSHQVHIGRNRNINQVPDAQRLNVANFEQTASANPTLNTMQVCALIAPQPCVPNPDTTRPFIGYSTINFNERAGSSSYNSLQVFFNQRVTHGVQFQAAYTYSKNLSDSINQDTEASTLPIQNAFDTRSERALANQDQTQSLVFNYIWKLPFFEHSDSAIRKNAFGGWQIVGISTFRSGLPQNICLDSDIAGTGDGQGVYECQRPDQVGNPNFSRGKRTIGEYFNTGAFVQPQLGSFGNATRNVVRGPGVNNWDISIFKEFTVPWFGRHGGSMADENATLQFRTEFFNAWNHTQFNGINTTFQTQGAGTPSGTSGGFGQVSGARDPRIIQFALKLLF
jgi:outer membrane receptor protein involved in Fe transport